jgi:hypothetical protein
MLREILGEVRIILADENAAFVYEAHDASLIARDDHMRKQEMRCRFATL